MEKHNFEITDNVTNEMAKVKQQLGLPMQLASCHTAVIDGYVIEGHVPAQDIERLIKEKPDNISGPVSARHADGDSRYGIASRRQDGSQG